MNRIKKRITVRFFLINASYSFLNDFVSIHNANKATEKSVRIVNIRGKKHLIKLHDELTHRNNKVFFLSVVRERNTWQTRALGNGNISGIPLNQGILGDPYYFLVLPEHQSILGFTTGPSGSLKSVAKTTLQQFLKDRSSTISIEHISKNNEFSKLKELSGYNKLYFKVNTTSIADNNESTPSVLSNIIAAPFMANSSQIELTFTEIGEGGFTEQNLIDIVNFLSENEGCSALTVQGLDNEGAKVHLDFNRAYVLYREDIEIRNKFVDEKIAKEVLFNALNSYEI